MPFIMIFYIILNKNQFKKQSIKDYFMIQKCYRRFILMILCINYLFIQVHNQPTNSDNCYNYNLNYSVCQQCNQGFFLEYFFCWPCNPRCLCSSKKDFCQSCIPIQQNGLNYYSYLDQYQNQCVLCSSVIQNCLNCQNNLFCSECSGGFYLLQQTDMDGAVTGQSCSSQICNLNCQICRDSSTCKICQQGYFLFPDSKTCAPIICASNCNICKNQAACLTCSQQFFLQVLATGQSSCQPCINNCTICINEQSCEACAPSYSLVNNTCTSNGLANCIQYANGNTVCVGCQAGYQVTGGSCNQCTGCNLCNQQFICTSSCLTSYQAFNFACLPVFQVHLTILIGLILSMIIIYF